MMVKCCTSQIILKLDNEATSMGKSEDTSKERKELGIMNVLGKVLIYHQVPAFPNSIKKSQHVG